MGALSAVRLFLLDLDGTFYLDDTPLPGALGFLAALRANHTPFLFLTNNSSRGRGDYLKKLNAMGAAVTETEIDLVFICLSPSGAPTGAPRRRWF